MFNPHENIGESSLLDSIYRILPDISNCQSESEIMPYKFKFLRSLIQVDSYQYPGTYSLSVYTILFRNFSAMTQSKTIIMNLNVRKNLQTFERKEWKVDRL